MRTFLDLLNGGNRFTSRLSRGGSGGGGSTTSTNYTTTLPEYAEPFYVDMMAKSEAVANQPYVPYEGPRIADWTDPQLLSQAGVEQLAMNGNPLMDSAGNYSYASNALNLAQATQADPLSSTYAGSQNYNPINFDPYYADVSGMYTDPSGGFVNPNGYMVDANGMYVDPTGMNYSPTNVSTDIWNSQWRDHYMSPYMDAVVQRQQEDAILQDQRQKAIRDQQAVQAGAFSGDRRFVSDALYGESLQNRLADINAEGLQSAYDNAQGMFTSDMARRLQAGMANQSTGLQAGLANQQAGLQAGLGNLDAYMRGQMANQGNWYDASKANLQALSQSQMANLDAATRAELSNQAAWYDAANLGEQSRQFGSSLLEEGNQYGSNLDYQSQLGNEQLRLDALRNLLGGTELMGNLGVTDQNAYLARMSALNDVGTSQQARQQDVYNQAYEDFINQRDYQRQALQWLSSQLQGVPVSTQANVVQYQPTPSMLSQMVGSGLGAGGLYNSYINA